LANNSDMPPLDVAPGLVWVTTSIVCWIKNPLGVIDTSREYDSINQSVCSRNSFVDCGHELEHKAIDCRQVAWLSVRCLYERGAGYHKSETNPLSRAELSSEEISDLGSSVNVALDEALFRVCVPRES